MDLLDLYERATAWTSERIPGAATQLERPTPCEEWTVRNLLDHMLQAQAMFAGAARGEPAAPPQGMPPALVGDDPVAQYERSRQETLTAFREEGAVEQYGQTLGIGFVDQLVHGWDLARATGQDEAMPDDLAAAAFGIVDGRIPDEARTVFKPAIAVPTDASARDKLLAYLGRQP